MVLKSQPGAVDHTMHISLLQENASVMNIQLQLTVVTLHIHLVFYSCCSLVLVMGEVIRRWRGDGGEDIIFYGSADN